MHGITDDDPIMSARQSGCDKNDVDKRHASGVVQNALQNIESQCNSQAESILQPTQIYSIPMDIPTTQDYQMFGNDEHQFGNVTNGALSLENVAFDKPIDCVAQRSVLMVKNIPGNGDENELEVRGTLLGKRSAENSSFDSSKLRKSKNRQSIKSKKLQIAQSENDSTKAQIEEIRDGGYALQSKGITRSAGIEFAVAMKDEEQRTCLPDAVYTILKNLNIDIDIKTVRSQMISDQGDPNVAMARQFASQYDVDLVYMDKLSKSPKNLIRESTGLFLIGLHIELPDGSSDRHFCVLSANVAGDDSIIIDNSRYRAFAKIEGEDRKNNQTAMRPFAYLFPLATSMRLDGVFKGERK